MVFGVPKKIISNCRNGRNGCTLIGVFEAKRKIRADEQRTPAERTQSEQVESGTSGHKLAPGIKSKGELS